MSRKPKTQVETPEATDDASTATPKDETATSVALVETQDPQAAEDVNATRECEVCAMNMPADSKDPACPMCFRDHKEFIMLRSLAAKGKTYCHAFHDGKRCTWVVNQRPDGKPVFCPKDRALRAIGAAKAKFANVKLTDEAQAKLDEAEGFFVEEDFWKSLAAAQQVFDLQDKPFVEKALAEVIEIDLGPRTREVYDEVMDHVERKQYIKAREAVGRMQRIARNEAQLLQQDRRIGGNPGNKHDGDEKTTRQTPAGQRAKERQEAIIASLSGAHDEDEDHN